MNQDVLGVTDSSFLKKETFNSKGNPLLPIKLNSEEKLGIKKFRTLQDLINLPIECYKKDKNNNYVAIDGITDLNSTTRNRPSINNYRNTSTNNQGYIYEYRLESDRRRRQRSYDNFYSNKQGYMPKRVDIFETDDNSTNPTLKEYVVQKLINNLDLINNPGYIQDIMYKAKFLEDENRKIRAQLEEKDSLIKSFEKRVSVDINTNYINSFDHESIEKNKLITDLQNQVKFLEIEKKKLNERVGQLEQSLKEEEYKIKLNMEANYRKYMEEHERRLVLDLMTNGEEFKTNYFKDHILKLNRELEDAKKDKIEINTLNKHSNTEMSNNLSERIVELEAENRMILNRYYEFKALLLNKNLTEALDESVKKVVQLEEQIRELKKKSGNDMIIN